MSQKNITRVTEIKLTGDRSDLLGLGVMVVLILMLAATLALAIARNNTQPPPLWEQAPPEVTENLREQARGRRWAVYRNIDLTDELLNDVRYLRVGESPPEHLMDTEELGDGWRWRYVGILNMDTGRVEQ